MPTDQTSPVSILLTGILFGLSTLVACGANYKAPFECPEADEADCELNDGFRFESYEPSCEIDERPDLCGLPSASPECIEPDFDIEELTIEALHDGLRSGDVTCQWVTQQHYDRILWQDLSMTETTPPMNAFVRLNEEALRTAELLDDYHQCEDELAGPLHCVPFGIKDNYASSEVPISAGSLALQEPQPDSDSFSVDRMRRAGAIMIGTTAMDELARGVHGLSGRSGKTGNAYDTRYNAGGSSSGSAVATAASMTMGALGTDNCSSLMMPAAYAGLFTMRSSIGLVSTEGIYPSIRVDMIAGPMTRTATDLAHFFDAVSDYNPRDRRHYEWDIVREQNYTDFLDPEGLQGKRIGILETLGQGDGERRLFDGSSSADIEHFDGFIEELDQAGAIIVDELSLTDFDGTRWGTGQGVDVDRFLDATTGGVSSHRELCETEMYSHWLFDRVDDCLDRANQSKSDLQKRIDRAEKRYADSRAYVQTKMDEFDIDAFLFPVDTRGGPSIRARSNNCVLPSVTGLPTVVVPAGFDDNDLPVGMAFLARRHQEGLLFEIAYGYEQATQHRAPPSIAPIESPPPLDAEQFNQVHYDLGLAGFEAVLGHRDKHELTADLFADLSRQTLQDHDLAILIDP